jgi:CheY-like chemotaxis protein
MVKKILIVEDDTDIARNLKELLESEGYQVVVSKNGKEALVFLQTDIPNLIILDLMMPIMDGFGFRQIQRSDPRISHIPVIVMSADGHVEDKKLQLGVTNFIRKPADLEEVLAAVSGSII